MTRYFVVLAIALVAALAGPRAFGPQNRSAGAPFAYEPPEGFVPFTDRTVDLDGAHAWQYQSMVPGDETANQVRVIVHHSARELSVEEADLARLSSEMKSAFENACMWVHRRHELRVRSDGARVGLIEGDCTREVDLGSLGLPAQVIRWRKLQLMFPDDTGTSIATISYPADQAARWEPIFESTISKARGVATRVPPTPPWVHAAWGSGGLIIGWLLTAMFWREKKADEKRKAPKRDEPLGDD